jgi:hypothetical protein
MRGLQPETHKPAGPFCRRLARLWGKAPAATGTARSSGRGATLIWCLQSRSSCLTPHRRRTSGSTYTTAPTSSCTTSHPTAGSPSSRRREEGRYDRTSRPIASATQTPRSPTRRGSRYAITRRGRTTISSADRGCLRQRPNSPRSGGRRRPCTQYKAALVAPSTTHQRS